MADFPLPPEEDEPDPQMEAQKEAEGALPEPDPAQDPAQPPPAAYESQENLAATLPHEFLRKLGQTVLTQAELDYKSSSSWREKAAQFHKLYDGDLMESVPDQENITIMHLPYAKRAVRMFKSKMFPNLYPPSGEIVAFKVRSPHLQEVAQRCSAHMNQQLINEVLEYIPGQDRGMTQLLIEGSIFSVWYYSPILGRPTNEICLAEDVWISYRHKCDRANLSDVPRITWRLRYHQHQLEELEDLGYYIGITSPVKKADGEQSALYATEAYDESGTPNGASTGPDSGAMDDRPVKEGGDEFIGQEEPSDDPDAPRVVLEQDRLLRLPTERRQRAVTVCVDKATGNVLRLTLREQDDPVDKKRFDLESAQFEEQLRSMEVMHEEAMKEWQLQAEQSQQQVIVDPVTGAPKRNPAFGQPPPQQPQPPKPPEQPKPVKRVPWSRWTKFDCEVNPRGALGHGILHDVGGHNILADKVATRAVSLLTLNMLPTTLISRQSRFARGEIKLKLGATNEMNLSPMEIERGAGMHQMQFPAPSPEWVKVIDQADKSCQEVTAFDIAMGAPGMSGETATESENRHSAATANISVIGARFNRARAADLRNLAYINSQTLPEEGVVVYIESSEMPAPPPPQDMGMGMPPGGPPPGDMGPPPGMDQGGQPPMGPPPPDEMSLTAPPPPQQQGLMAPPPPMGPPAPAAKIPVTVTREDYAMILDELEVTFTCDPEMESAAVKERRAMKMFQTAIQVATTPVDPMGTPLLDMPTTTMILRGVAAKVFEALDMPKEYSQMILNAPMPMPALPPPPPGEHGEGEGEGPPGQGPGGVPGESSGPPA